MFGSLKIAMVAILITGIAGAGMYVMKLRSDNAILKANQLKLESAVADQQELLESQKKDFEEILGANKKMNELVSVLKKDLEDLDKRFNKKNRDVGKLAIAKTKSIERITNGASALATRCIEIASGSPLTEKEKMLQRSQKSILNVLVLLILTTFLTSCAGVKTLEIFKKEVPRENLNLEKPTPLELENLRWIIITSENAEEVFKKLEEQGIDPVLWGLTDKDFELLAKNFARIRNQLKITNDLLDNYKEYYEGEDDEQK